MSKDIIGGGLVDYDTKKYLHQCNFEKSLNMSLDIKEMTTFRQHNKEGT